MPSIHISLPQDLYDYVQACAASSEGRSIDEVISHVLRETLKREESRRGLDEFLSKRLESVDRKEYSTRTMDEIIADAKLRQANPNA